MTTVTLLFTDLVGSTELLDRLGDDAAETLRRRHFGILREAVAAQGGHEVKNLGDGLMVVFRSAVDAVACAVGMQRAIERHNAADRGPRLEVRVGLHVGEPIRDEDDYFGMPVVIAERLCGKAGAGQIIASEPVRELVGARGGYEFAPLGSLDLKGVATPVAASEIAWEAPLATTASSDLPPELTLGERSFFVSRESELERLTYVWKEAAAGTPRAVLVAGEAGIGKTSLAAELARRAHDDGWTVLFGRCDEEPGLTYQPFAEALRHYVSGSSPEELRAFPPSDLAALVRIVPDLADRVPGLPPPARGDRESERYRMFESVVRLLGGAARRSPVLLVLDDLHWAAKPSLLLLRHLVRAGGTMPLLIVATYRDTDVHRGHPLADVLADLRREPAVERLSLDGLDEDGVTAFVTTAAGRDLRPDELALAHTLYRETEGNPFFLREILYHLADTGVLDRASGDWIQPRLAEVGIPEGVREVVGRRLSNLSDDANRALSLAAVVGQTFSYQLLEDVIDTGIDQLLDVLDEAVDGRVIVEALDRPGSYSFAHALIRQVLLAELSSARRARMHLRVGEALEATPVREEHLAALAHHFAEGGQPAKAADYALKAAARAGDQLAFEEASAHLERGLHALELAEPPDDLRRADLLLALAEARLDAGDVDGHKNATRDAAKAGRAAGSAVRLGKAAALHMHLSVVGTPDPDGAATCEEALAALGDDQPALRSRVLAGLAYYRALSESQGVAASALAQEALDIAHAVGDDDALALALFVRAICLTGSVHVDERIRLADELLALAARTGDLFHRSQGLRVRAPARLELGDVAGFEADLNALERTGTELRSWYALALASEWKVLRAMMRGRFDDADAFANEVMEHGGREQNFVNVWTTQLFFLYRERGRLAEIYPVAKQAIEANPGLIAFVSGLALMDLELGRTDDAAAQFDEIAADNFAMVPHDATWTACLSVLTEVCATLGDAERAGRLYEMFLPRRGNLVVWVWGVACAGSVDRYLGMLAATKGDATTAAVHYEAALEHEQAIDGKPLVARTQYWYARLLLASEDDSERERARLLLEESRRAADELGMLALSLDAAALT